MTLPFDLTPKPTASGIVATPSGERVIAASRRADGSIRKERKVRPGYTPEEDVERYRATRAREEEERRNVKGVIPGLPPPVTTQVASPPIRTTLGAHGAGRGKGTRSLFGNALGQAISSSKGGTTPRGMTSGVARAGHEAHPTTTRIDSESQTGSGDQVVDASSSLKAFNGRSSASSGTSPPTVPAGLESQTTTVDPTEKLTDLVQRLQKIQAVKERQAAGLYLLPADRARLKELEALEQEIARLSLREDGVVAP